MSEIVHSFTGYALNAVDAKGRVSVPAAFRELIATRCRLYGGEAGTVDDKELVIGLHESLDHLQVFDAIGQQQLARDLRASVADLPAAERRRALEELSRGEFGNNQKVSFDGAGRMVLPPMLRDFAGIGDLALFWATGDYFEIWSPARAREAFADNRRNLMTIDYLLRERGMNP